MQARHGKARLLCSELVTVEWTTKFGQKREVVANLEEIWETGVQLDFPRPIAVGTQVRIHAAKVEWTGTVRSCQADFIGHFVDVEFDGGYRWSCEKYEPEHLLDPRGLGEPEDELKKENRQLLAECAKSLSSRVL